jgi:hypothetical protein
MEGGGCGLKHFPSICLEELRESMRILSRNNWSLGHDLKLGPSEHEAAVLTTQ